jgi:hypothetical protein
MPKIQADNRLDHQERSIPGRYKKDNRLDFQERSIPDIQADNRLGYLCYFPNTLLGQAAKDRLPEGESWRGHSRVFAWNIDFHPKSTLATLAC